MARFGFACNNRKKNATTGEWEDDPMFVDVKAFNREEGRKLADLVVKYLSKGQQVYVEGRLVLEKWEDKNSGSSRSKHVIVMEDLQFLEPKTEQAAAPTPKEQPVDEQEADDFVLAGQEAAKEAAAAAPNNRPAPTAKSPPKGRGSKAKPPSQPALVGAEMTAGEIPF